MQLLSHIEGLHNDCHACWWEEDHQLYPPTGAKNPAEGGKPDVFIQTNNALSRQFRGLSDKYVDVETNVTNPVEAQQLKAGRPAAQ